MNDKLHAYLHIKHLHTLYLQVFMSTLDLFRKKAMNYFPKINITGKKSILILCVIQDSFTTTENKLFQFVRTALSSSFEFFPDPLRILIKSRVSQL